MQITVPQRCTGCLACRAVCPVQCISAVEDNEGFQVPRIDEARCTDCGVCASICPEENNREESGRNDCLKVFGVKIKDGALLGKSASGGVFAGIASEIIETRGGAVFGCAFDDDLVARHICINDMKDIGPLQSSKYVQSDTGDTFSQVKSLLDEGKMVFYTGTPCQIAGLYAYIGEGHSNLLTADLICHGVPSPLLFRRYIGRLRKKYGGEPAYYDFRCKEQYGWGVRIKVVVKSVTRIRTRYINWKTDPYCYSFLDARTYRECCYTCKYANSRRVGDLTIGDFWGVERVHPEFYDSKGVSVVLVNTERGERIFASASGRFDTIETTFENAAVRNANLEKPALRPSLRDAAYNGIYDENTDVFKNPAFIISKKIIIKTRIKSFIKLILPRSAIELLKRTAL